MRPGLVPLSLLVAATVAGCSGSEPEGPEDPNQPAPPVRPGSLVILTGEGQTAPAGSTFSDPVEIEVRDSNGAALPGVEVRIEEALAIGPFLDHGPPDTTGADGRVTLAWAPGAEAGLHRLRAGVYLVDAAWISHLVVADTIGGTVTPAAPSRVDLSGPTALFLGETLDLATVIVGPVFDPYSNPVTVTSLTVDAPPPFVANGTVVHSDVEADTLVNIVINGVPFGYRLEARRDLREMAGATGGWVCDREPGSPTATPGLFIRRRVVSVTVDSVTYIQEWDMWNFHMSQTWHDLLSDGSEGDGAEAVIRLVQDQWPGAWGWDFGPPMLQTGTAPLSYTAAEAECITWDHIEGGPPAHEPFHLSR